jgi:hypothetical protein
MHNANQKINQTEFPVYMEFIWLTTVSLLTKSFSEIEIEQLSELTIDRCRGYGIREKDLTSFRNMITGLNKEIQGEENGRKDN